MMRGASLSNHYNYRWIHLGHATYVHSYLSP